MLCAWIYQLASPGEQVLNLVLMSFVEAFAFEFGFFADTLKAAAALLGIEAHSSAGAGLVFEVVNQLIAGYGRTVLIQGKAVAGGNGIGGLVVLRPIGVENIGIALDNDVAFGTDADLGSDLLFLSALTRV